MVYPLSPVIGGEGRGEGLGNLKSEISKLRFHISKLPLTLTLSPDHRGEGMRRRD
jgi:hypothetical protein